MAIPERVTPPRRVWIGHAEVHGTGDSLPPSMRRHHSVRPAPRGVTMPVMAEYSAHGARLRGSDMRTPQPFGRSFYTINDVLWTNWVSTRLLWQSQIWRQSCPPPVQSHWAYIALQAFLQDREGHHGELLVGFKIKGIEPTQNGRGTVSLARLVVLEGDTPGQRRFHTMPVISETVWTADQLDERFTQLRSTGLVPIYDFVNQHAPDVFSAGVSAAASLGAEVAERGIRHALKRFALAAAEKIGISVWEAIKEMAKHIWRNHPELRRGAQRGEVVEPRISETEAREIAVKGVSKFIETMITETVGSWVSDAYANDPAMQRRFLTHTVCRAITETFSTHLLQAFRDATIRTYVQRSADETAFGQTLVEAWGETLAGSVEDTLRNLVGVGSHGHVER
jgi:hypothetical protein